MNLFKTNELIHDGQGLEVLENAYSYQLITGFTTAAAAQDYANSVGGFAGVAFKRNGEHRYKFSEGLTHLDPRGFAIAQLTLVDNANDYTDIIDYYELLDEGEELKEALAGHYRQAKEMLNECETPAEYTAILTGYGVELVPNFDTVYRFDSKEWIITVKVEKSEEEKGGEI